MEKIGFHLSPHCSITLHEGHTSAKSLSSNYAFKMVYHPIVTLLAHMSGYMLRKTFIYAGFRMNALIRGSQWGDGFQFTANG